MSEIDAVLVKQIESDINHFRFVWPARCAFHAAINRSAAIHRQRSSSSPSMIADRVGRRLNVLDHAGQALGVFGAALSVEAYSIAFHHHLESIAIPIRFMQPVRSARWAHGVGEDVRRAKVGRPRKPEYIYGQPPAARAQNLDRKTSRWPDGSADCSPALFVAWWAKRSLKPCRSVVPKQVSGSGVKPYGSVGTMPQGKKASPGTEATDDSCHRL